jgi:hypothetical protein
MPAHLHWRRSAPQVQVGGRPKCATRCNLCRTLAHRRLAFLSRSTAGQAGGLCSHLRGNSAEELRFEVNPRCSVSLPSAFATCALSNRCSRLLGQSVDCSTLDGRKRATEFELEALCLRTPKRIFHKPSTVLPTNSNIGQAIQSVGRIHHPPPGSIGRSLSLPCFDLHRHDLAQWAGYHVHGLGG